MQFVNFEGSPPETDPPSEAADQLLFSRRLVPHRSLTQVQFQYLITFVGIAGVITTIPFFIMGAWPIIGFMGLDIACVYVAFRINFRDARAYEDVRMTPLELLLSKVSAKGVKRNFRFNPAWVRLESENHEEFGLLRLAFASRGREVPVANFLGPDEKARFAEDFSRALAQAKRGPQF